MKSIIFKIKMFIGKNLTESFYKKMAKKLSVEVYNHSGSVNIEWSFIGSGNKPKIVFLHGFSDRKENFYFAAKYLLKKYDIIIPDMPGFGNSSVDGSITYSLENYENWLGDFIENNEFKDFHLVGNSLGGAVSAKLALKYSHRIKSLILVNPAGFYISGEPSIYDEALKGVNLFQIATPEEYENFRGRIFFQKPKLPAFVKEFMIDSAIKNREWYGKIFSELADIDLFREGIKTLEELSLNSICNKIVTPTMIFWGRFDTLFPYKTAEYLNKEINECQVYIFENIGHCPHLENPKEFSEKLEEFITVL